MPRTKTPLENLINDIYEPEDADPAVLEAALRESGVDVDAERVRYDAAVAAAVNRLRRGRLEQARSQRQVGPDAGEDHVLARCWIAYGSASCRRMQSCASSGRRHPDTRLPIVSLRVSRARIWSRSSRT